MSLLITIALVLVGLFVLLQVLILWQSRRMTGQPVRLTGATARIDPDRPALLYFHSPRCGACRGMTPVIAELGREDSNVVSIDVSRDMETASAYSVRATPTLVVLKEGAVAKVLLGAQSRQVVESLLR
ncbi:MAG: thioredoxin family protein [Gammaproteobacteria bacterium]|nr:thioredoxin family protein [Gammaproteobacteria bacterium]MBU1654388.1 thioredoxin family protein [Gammaproteobacteria bacterium]MBU1960229.1 thioredoxin family protein [Gammaproteobacteria bacterium]